MPFPAPEPVTVCKQLGIKGSSEKKGFEWPLQRSSSRAARPSHGNTRALGLAARGARCRPGCRRGEGFSTARHLGQGPTSTVTCHLAGAWPAGSDGWSAGNFQHSPHSTVSKTHHRHARPALCPPIWGVMALRAASLSPNGWGEASPAVQRPLSRMTQTWDHVKPPPPPPAGAAGSPAPGDARAVSPPARAPPQSQPLPSPCLGCRAPDRSACPVTGSETRQEAPSAVR